MSNKSGEERIDAAHKKEWRTFEVVFGVPFLVSIVLKFAIPLSLLQGALSPAVIAGGVFLIAVGVSLIILARREFAQHGQPTDPGRPTEKLVTTGVFSISRNPLYLGGVCFLTGLALAFNLTWFLIFLLPSIVACHYVLIAPEERYLADKFGKRYRVYAATVYRWLGRKTKMD